MHDIYREQILDHYKFPHNFGPIEDADLSHCEENPTCGDRICIDINWDNEKKVKDIHFHGHGCAISQASASMLTDKVLEENMNVESILKLAKEDILSMLGIQLSPIRLKCALLSLEVLQKTVKNLK
ncbi:MAG: iron-sulfur cluster assembly scaffold protein [bacterium]